MATLSFEWATAPKSSRQDLQELLKLLAVSCPAAQEAGGQFHATLRFV